MNNTISFFARFFVFLVVLALTMPESYAKRAGGARSLGRQSQVAQQAPAPRPPQSQQAAPPPVAPQPAPAQGVQPGSARQSGSSVDPAHPIARQARSPWGGMLGGALIGLGLGSLLTSNDGNADPASQNAANQSSGMQGSGTEASGTAQESAVQPAEPPLKLGVGGVLLLGILALLVYFLVRRARARASRRHSP